MFTLSDDLPKRPEKRANPMRRLERQAEREATALGHRLSIWLESHFTNRHFANCVEPECNAQVYIERGEIIGAAVTERCERNPDVRWNGAPMSTEEARARQEALEEAWARS